MRCAVSYKKVLFNILAVFVVGACTSDKNAAPVLIHDDGVEERNECVDADGDGFSARNTRCPIGNDCDDTDPEVKDECHRCIHPSEGCPCEADQPPITCHLESTNEENGDIVCHEGTRFCQEGKWTDCQSVRSYLAISRSNTAKIIDPDAGVQRCSACNVNCYRVTDMLDPVDGGMITGNSEGGIECEDGGGLTLTPIDASDDADSVDAGIPEESECTPGVSPDFDCDGIPDEFDPYPEEKPFDTSYETLLFQIGPGQSETKSLDIDFFVNNADIYFLLDQTGSMSEERENLKAGLTSGTYLSADVQCADTDFDGHPNNELKNQGIIGSIRCLIRDAWFGTGFHRELPFYPHGDDDEVIFRNLQDISADISKTLGAIIRMENDGNRDWAEGHSQALYSVATGGGLYLGYDRPGVPERTDCPDGRWGYPCFREDAIPIVVLFTDAMFHNGPYPYYSYNDTYSIRAGTEQVYYSVPATNETFNSAYSVGNITNTMLTYIGDTSDMSGDIAGSLVGCGTSDAAVDAVFQFDLSAQRTVTIDSSGSQYDTVIALFDQIPTTGGSPTTISVSGNEDHLSPYAVGDMNNDWFVGSGNTGSMDVDYQGSVVGCSANTSARDAVYTFDLSSAANVTIETAGSSYDTVISLHDGVLPLRPSPITVPDTNDTMASAYAIGDMNGQYKVLRGDTGSSGINADFSNSMIGCGADSGAKDAVYAFSLTQATRVRVDTEDSAFDTVLSLHSGSGTPLSRPSPVSIGTGGEEIGSAYNAGTIDNQWKVFSGNTSTMQDNWGSFRCGSDRNSRDAFIRFSLNATRTVTIDTVNSSFDTTIGLYRWNNQSLIDCDNDSGGNSASRLSANLSAGTYFVVIKGDGRNDNGYYELSINDSGGNIACDNDGGEEATSVIEEDLDAGDYYVVVKGRRSWDAGDYTLTLRDVTARPTNLVTCSNDAWGSTSRIEQTLDAGSYTVVVKGDDATSHGSYKITIKNDPLIECNDDGGISNTSKIDRTLDPGTYYVVLKSYSSSSKGSYQITFGGVSSSSESFSPIAWSTTLDAMKDKGIKMMSVLSCRDDPSYGDRWDGNGACDITRRQAQEIATETETFGSDGEGDPLVLDINRDGSGLSMTVVEGIQELADYLSMNIGLRIVDSPDTNPGFLIDVQAVDTGPGDGCEPPIDGVHQNCLPGATPSFRVTIENPLNDPVPFNPDPNKDGYDFRAELIGNTQDPADESIVWYTLESIPVYVIPEEEPPPAETYESGVYWQDVNALMCTGNTRPDWSDLVWTADLPSGTSIQFDACASDSVSDLDSCTFKQVASVTASGICSTDSDCTNGYCGPNNLCQIITGTSCNRDSDCILGVDCVDGSCMYSKQPADAAIALGTENLLFNLRMRITLRPDGSRHRKPTLTEWSLNYECVATR